MSRLKRRTFAIITAFAAFISAMFSVAVLPGQRVFAEDELVIVMDYDISTDSDQWYTVDDIEFYADGILVYYNGEDVTAVSYIKFNSVPSEVYDGINEYYNIPVRAEYKGIQTESIITVKIKGRIILGDVSGNKKVDLQDAILIAKYLLGSTKFDNDQMKAADYNENGTIDLLDVIGIAKYLLKK